MQDGKFHPHTPNQKGVRKSREQKEKTQGVKIRKQRVDARPKITKHISPRLIKNIEELSRTLSDDNLSGGLRGTRYNGTMAFWSQLKRETDIVSELIKEENLENEVVTAVPPEVVKETLRMKRDATTVDISDLSDFTLGLRIQKLQNTKDDLEFEKKLEGITNLQGITKALSDAEKEKKMRTDSPKTQSQLADFITRKFNKEIPSAKKSPFRGVNFREILRIGKNRWTFIVSLGSGDDETVEDIKKLGFQVADIRDVLDSRHATFEGDLGLG
jgi:hypothetical protein